MSPETIAGFSVAGGEWTRLVGLAGELFPGTSFADLVEATLNYLGDVAGAVPPTPSGPHDKPMFDALESLKSVIDWGDFTVREGACRRTIISPASDELMLQVAPESWTHIYLLCHALLANVRPSRRSAVVVSMRDDGLRIVEWIAHYRAIGFEGIFIYSNDNRDGSDALLACLADAGVITFIRNEVTGEVSPPRKALEHSLWSLPELRQFKWVLFADSDEFLRLPEASGFAIPTVLRDVEKSYPDRLPSAICYQWKWFVSGRTVFQSDATLLERFEHSISSGSIKSVVLLRDVLTMRRLHFPLCGIATFFVDSTLRTISESLSRDQQSVWNYTTPQYAGGQLNHYWTKSFQEFLVKKGRGDTLANTDNKREFEQFFLWNGVEDDDNRDSCPEPLLSRVLDQIRALRGVDGVRNAETRVREAHDAMFDASGGAAALQALYDTHEPDGYGAKASR